MLLHFKQQQLKLAKQQLWPAVVRRQQQSRQQLLQHAKQQQNSQRGRWLMAHTSCHMQLLALQRHR
jgi:hypothetical protein